MRVGPTLIVGNIARINVPNRAVQERALELKHFTCMDKELYLFRNDRIIDNPEREWGGPQGRQPLGPRRAGRRRAPPRTTVASGAGRARRWP
ncbi:hypothetical protein STCU_11114 [Strigomonas culicis]|uniref:Uncharacterized protein n=1 Tax=Strigomonas culicis TaxID=28005 RepID=S9UPS1_9TRYP|nr:hypothetical protein STCU_11114 [Strigomonas culicis]|eukprot:EPY16601.1 hypothetical protein STCU_11114 [Strigomonas culicis]